MQDIEFTVEEGTLYLLQTRTGKRTAAAALRIAVDMVAEELLTQEEAVARVDPGQLDQLLHPMIDSGAEFEVAAGPERLTRGRHRRDRAGRRPGPGSGQRGGCGHPRPHRDDAGRHPRDHQGPRSADRARRHDLARRGGGAGWGSRACRAARRSRSTRRGASAWAITSWPRATCSRSTGAPAMSSSARCRSYRRASTRTSRRSSAGRTGSVACACGRTPTRRRTRRRRGSSARKGSASAGRSTCSWPRSACPTSRR